ncbi:MAG TPA: 4-(cytidine 5'-diphospho)-2-C-methyl-D-erythritol kinase, partial [Sphingomicrobium sp.]|nr:4-(cytidine 5'-diphospho)-2-C-methyl-D-erythritol kinase [Sphingomicrobium sp.]
MELKELAPAKVNLALHVRGKLPDGRHRIETVFAFCTDGDEVAATTSDGLSLSLAGPFARELGDSKDNLALKAARALRERAGVAQGAALTLTKKLPVAS